MKKLPYYEKILSYFDNIKARVKDISAHVYKLVEQNIIAEQEEPHKIDFSKKGIKTLFVLPLRKLIVFVRQRREDYLRLLGPDEEAIKASMMLGDNRYEIVEEDNLEKSSLIFKLIFLLLQLQFYGHLSPSLMRW